MRYSSHFFTTAAFLFVMWIGGTYDKYPELLLPLFFIYVATISPAFTVSDFERKWNQLEKRRMKAVKANNLDEECKIEEERTKLELYNIPLTLGHLDTFRKELDERFIAVGKQLYRIQEMLQNAKDERSC